MTSTADKDTGDLWQVEMKGHRQRDYWEAEAGTTVGTRSKKKSHRIPEGKLAHVVVGDP